MPAVLEEITVEDAVPVKAAVTKTVMRIYMSANEKTLCESLATSSSFLRKCKWVVPVLFLAGLGFLLDTLGGFSAIAGFSFEFGDDPREAEATIFLSYMAQYWMSLWLLFCTWGVIGWFFDSFERAVKCTERVREDLLRQHGWDGIAEYRIKVSDKQDA